MLFCSEAYLVFLALIFTVYWAIPVPRLRVWLLLVASFYFYASWNKWLAGLICVSTAMDYAVALGMDRLQASWKRKLLLGLSLVANLGLLCYFKYANFFLDSLDHALRSVGATASLPILNVILPVGISFYTFEAINYTVDVYRRRIPAEKNLANFMLFITFFPHLVAGPIVRARDFLPQIKRPKRWDWARMQLGAQYLLMGAFKKMAIADRMALYSQPVYENPEAYGTQAVWLATLAFTIRIYCDFSGYTDMALGSAHLLGYKLARNFNMPYVAANVSEFWRRWHISLSSWLRDYLFIPLGGSRGSNWATARNLIITMTLGGLWHGVSWMFVVWGLVHGILLVVHRAFRSFCEMRPRLDRLVQSIPGRSVAVALTLFCVMMTWVLFYTGSLEAESALVAASKNAAAGQRVQATTYNAVKASRTIFKRLFTNRPGFACPIDSVSLWCTVALMVVCHALAQRGLWRKIATRLPAPAMGLGYALVLCMALVLAPDAGKAFIYFQF